jgi:hypothetical protein
MHQFPFQALSFFIVEYRGPKCPALGVLAVCFSRLRAARFAFRASVALGMSTSLRLRPRFLRQSTSFRLFCVHFGEFAE